MTSLDGNANDMTALEERLSFLIHTMSTRIALIGYRLHREHGINHFTARILVLLLEHQELRISDLVDLLVLPQSTVSSHLQVLQKKGLIRRRRSRKDSRSVFISLSITGLPLAQACNEQSQRAIQAMLSDIDEEQRSTVFDFLRKVNQRLAQMQEVPVETAPQPESTASNEQVAASSHIAAG